MEKFRELPWLRIFAEGVAIVVSILLAFSIEAWWQLQSDEEQERELLQALLDDFTSTKEEIPNWRGFHIAVESSTKSLLNSALSNDSSLTGDKLPRLISNITWFDRDSHFVTGALNSLVNGGDLSRIRDDTLRRVLADWPSQIESAEAMQRQDYEFFVDVLTPFLRANANLPQLASEGSVRPGEPQTVFPRIEADMTGESTLDQLLENQEFQNILMHKTWIQFDILRAIDEIDLLLDQTITLLNGALSEL
jgi:hypothetical protein